MEYAHEEQYFRKLVRQKINHLFKKYFIKVFFHFDRENYVLFCTPWYASKSNSMLIFLPAKIIRNLKNFEKTLVSESVTSQEKVNTSSCTCTFIMFKNHSLSRENVSSGLMTRSDTDCHWTVQPLPHKMVRG